MITDIDLLKEAIIAKFGDDGLRIWNCLRYKVNHANYILGHTDTFDCPSEYYDDPLIDDYDYFDLESDFTDEVDEDCDYSSMHIEEYPLDEMTHFMISTVELDYMYDTIYGYAKVTDDGTVERMNVSNYGDRNVPYSLEYHKSIQIQERECLPSEKFVGLIFDRTVSFKTDRGYKGWRTLYTIVK